MADERWLLVPVSTPTPQEMIAFGARMERDGEHLIWTGPIRPDRKGRPTYGMTQYRGETVAAHRLAFAFANGGFPPKPFIVAHRCDRKLCCAPNCLLNSSKAENNDDQWRLREVGNTWG